MSVKFHEMIIKGNEIKSCEVVSKVYRICESFKSCGRKETMFYVWSKRENKMRWVWSSHCEVIC